MAPDATTEKIRDENKSRFDSRVETVVRTRRHVIDAGKFPMFSVDWTWREFLSRFGSLPVGFEWRVVTMMWPVDLRTSL